MCFDQDGVVLTVLPHLAYLDVVAGGLALVPEFLSTTAVEPDIVAGQSAAQGFLIHVAEHQHLTGIGILNYGWDKTFFVIF